MDERPAESGRYRHNLPYLRQSSLYIPMGSIADRTAIHRHTSIQRHSANRLSILNAWQQADQQHARSAHNVSTRSNVIVAPSSPDI